MTVSNNANTFYKTFTGSDSLAFAIFPNSKPILLGSLTTISYSIYREKRPVPLLGRINVGGYTRGMRSIAGTLIFTLINQQFIRDVVDQIPYLNVHNKIKADELPFFDIMVINANEMGSSCQMMIYGIDLFEEGQILSIQDLFIENNFSFVARDIDEFDSDSPLQKRSKASNDLIQKIGNVEYVDSTYTYNDDEILRVQKALYEKGYLNKEDIVGTYNNKTFNAIYKYQNDNNIKSNVLDYVTYSSIVNNSTCSKVTNKNGAFIYDFKKNIIGKLKYNESVILEDNTIRINNIKGVIKKEDFKNKNIAPKTSEYKMNVKNFSYSVKNKDVVANVIYENGNSSVFNYRVENNISENIGILSKNPINGEVEEIILFIKNENSIEEVVNIKCKEK